MAPTSRLLLAIALAGVLSPSTGPAGAETPPVPAGTVAFPPADPESVGLSAAVLEALADRVQAMALGEEIVGGELLVIKDRRTVLRQAFGWMDRESETPMPVDAVYSVRSMTKPLVGTAVQMLIDEGRLRLDTPVHEILPSFAGPRAERITVEHLLTHTGGLPFTTISRPLDAYGDLAEVAAEAAGRIEHEPGSRFAYSDAGSDTLGAIVADVSGMSAERFIEQRILDPLGMRDAFTLLAGAGGARARVPSAYSGGTGAWSRHWQASDPPLFPLFLTSQSLYATTTDYARFLALWMDGGKLGDRRLLSARAARRALTPHQPIRAADGSIVAHYGQQWVIYPGGQDGGAARRPAFGHDGSDGTHAWAWPEEDLMVLLFTQSRGTLAGQGFERVAEALLIDQALDDPSLAVRAPEPAALDDVSGLYWDETNAAAYYVVTPWDGRFVLERPGRARLVFEPGETPGRFVHEGGAPAWIEFVRDESGAALALRTSFAGRLEEGPRHVPVEGLPSAGEVVAAVERAHGLGRLPALGAVRLRGTVRLEQRGMEGTVSMLFDRARQRTEIDYGSAREITVVDGDRAWSKAPALGVTELEGPWREQALLDRLVVTLGDWRRHYRSVEVLKRLQAGDDTVLLVRVVPDEAPGATLFVDETTGRVAMVHSLAQLPGLGIVGVETRFQDLRDVGGMRLPFRIMSKYATPLIGTVVTTLERAETGIEPPLDAFAPPQP